MAKHYTILHGDCLVRLKELPDNSVDSCVTDPPYGLSKEPDIDEVLTKWLAGEPYDHRHGGFMGKAWDSFVPHPDIWREVYRVLKPGGHALVFAGTRTQDLMTVSLRLAGFEVRDVIEWLYFSGFPKSQDVGKAFDKRAGRAGKCTEQIKEALSDYRKKSGMTLKELNEACGFEASGYLRKSSTWASVLPEYGKWVVMRDVLEIPSSMDEIFKSAERENVGVGTSGKTYAMGGMRGEQTSEGTFDITAPATDLARKWDGWGTALKPAHEPIIVVRKPLIDVDTGRKLTVADCVEKYGTGAINVDATRIAHDEPIRVIKAQDTGDLVFKQAGRREDTTELKPEGRFPANAITTEADAFYSKYFNVTPQELSKKASKKDRNSDWKGEEIGVPLKEKTFGNDKGDGFGRGLSDSKLPTRNNHPTVKPTDLMAWLVRLVTPPQGIVLDPFAGSGSTLVAAKREGFGFIGIEREAEYVEIIEARTGEKNQAV